MAYHDALFEIASHVHTHDMFSYEQTVYLSQASYFGTNTTNILVTNMTMTAKEPKLLMIYSLIQAKSPIYALPNGWHVNIVMWSGQRPVYGNLAYSSKDIENIGLVHRSQAFHVDCWHMIYTYQTDTGTYTSSCHTWFEASNLGALASHQ